MVNFCSAASSWERELVGRFPFREGLRDLHRVADAEEHVLLVAAHVERLRFDAERVLHERRVVIEDAVDRGDDLRQAQEAGGRDGADEDQRDRESETFHCAASATSPMRQRTFASSSTALIGFVT